jgi:purine-binding chemotaxis protein CheW
MPWELSSFTETDEDTQKGKYLTFALDNEEYGIEIKYVTEIIGIQNIIHTPGLPEFIGGIINLRGKAIPVLDARLKLNKEPSAYTGRTCVIVVDINILIGLIVDKVSEVITISDENIADPPQIYKMSGGTYIKGIGKTKDGVKLLLDCEKLLTADEQNEIRSAI